MAVYDLLINFIYDNLDKSVESILDVIKYLSENDSLSLDDKIKYFWNYIKTFLKIAGVTETNKFKLFKQDYDSMIIIEKKNNISPMNNCIYEPIKKIDRTILDKYKVLMNSKLKTNLYEYLDKEYYLIKFGISNDNVMKFLQKNMNMYVRDNNKVKLIELFQTFIFLGKINLKKKYNMTMNEIIYVQKRRIEKFDIIFSNLVGAFNNIFKKYYTNENKISFSTSINNKNKNRINNSIEEIKKQINFIKSSSFINNLEKEENKNFYMSSFDYNNINNIKIPSNTSEIRSKILLLAKKDSKNKKNIFNKSNIRINYKLKKYLLSKKNLFLNKYISNNINQKEENSNLPIINSQETKNNNHLLNFSDGDIQSTHKNSKTSIRRISSYKVKNNKEKMKLKKNSIINEKEKPNFILRNINNILITKLIDLFIPLYKIENNLLFEEDEKIKYKEIYPRKIDLYTHLNLPNIIKSYYSFSIKGSNTIENQDSYFYYKDYMLIKNLLLLGVCDGHGKLGNLISEKISILFPSYLIYIIIEDYLIKENKDINKEIYKLFKLKENPQEVKDMYLLRYFFNKFNIDFKKIPLFNDNISLLKNQIYESFHYSHYDLKHRYSIDYDFSGTTICSCFVVGDILYTINLGDSQIILGSFYDISNNWEVKSLSVKHTFDLPQESLRIISNGGRIDRMKNENGKEVGPLRVYDNNIESDIPGLSMSRSIGDNFAKKFGVSYEPEVSKIKLKKEDKIIVLGTDGLFNYFNYEDIINIVSNFYLENKNAEEAAYYLIECVKNKYSNKLNSSKKRRKGLSNSEINESIYRENYDDITCQVLFLDI